MDFLPTWSELAASSTEVAGGAFDTFSPFLYWGVGILLGVGGIVGLIVLTGNAIKAITGK